jgi:hypothetical protein
MNWISTEEAQPSDTIPRWVYCKDTNSFHKAVFKNAKWHDATTIYAHILEVSHWIDSKEFEKILPPGV